MSFLKASLTDRAFLLNRLAEVEDLMVPIYEDGAIEALLRPWL